MYPVKRGSTQQIVYGATFKQNFSIYLRADSGLSQQEMVLGTATSCCQDIVRIQIISLTKSDGCLYRFVTNTVFLKIHLCSASAG